MRSARTARTFRGNRQPLRNGQARYPNAPLTRRFAMSRRSGWRLLVTTPLLVLLAVHGLMWAQTGASSAGSSLPPFDLGDPTIVEAGSRLFRATCTHYCHNPEGRAARAPALRGRPELSPEFIYQRIVRGVPPMPAYGTSLSGEQIWTLVAYIRSLAKTND